MARRELTEAEWLRRAIRHCEWWRMPTPATASFMCRAVHRSKRRLRTSTWEIHRLDAGEREAAEQDGDAPIAGWLPFRFREVELPELRSRLAALESEAA